jgi:WD40 repeat protein
MSLRQSKMKIVRAGLLAFIYLMLVACQSPQPAPALSPISTVAFVEVTAMPTAAMRPTQTSTAIPTRFITTAPRPTIAQPTLAPSATPYPPGALSGVPVPQPAEAISAENVTRVTELARWGKGTISKVAYSEDGKTLIVTSSVGTFLHDARTLQEIGSSQDPNATQVKATSPECKAATGAPDKVGACSPDNQTAVVGEQGSLKLISADGKVLKKVEFPENYQWEAVQQIVYTPESAVALSIENGTIFIWHLADDALIVIPGFGWGNLAISPDGTRFAAGYDDGWVRLYNAHDGKLIRTLKGHDIGEVWAVFSPDNATLVTASHDGVIRLWRASDGEFLQSLPGHANPAPVSPVVFNQDVLASASGRTIQIRQMSDGSIRQMFEVPANGNRRIAFEDSVGRVINLALSPDGSILASGMDDGLIHLWRVPDGSFIKTLDNGCSLWGRMVFSPDGLQLAAEGYWLGCNTVGVLQTDNGEAVFADDGTKLVMSLDGSKIAYVNTKGIEIRDGATGKPLASFDSGRWGVEKGLVFAPDNQTLLSISEGGFTDLWQVDSGKHLGTLEPNLAGVRGISFSADGKLMAALSFVGQVGLWRTSDWAQLNLSKDYIDSESSLVFSPDGQLVLTTSKDGLMRFWQVADGTLLHAIQGVKANQLAFVRSNLLMTAGFDGTIRLWGIPAYRQ